MNICILQLRLDYNSHHLCINMLKVNVVSQYLDYITQTNQFYHETNDFSWKVMDHYSLSKNINIYYLGIPYVYWWLRISETLTIKWSVYYDSELPDQWWIILIDHSSIVFFKF